MAEGEGERRKREANGGKNTEDRNEPQRKSQEEEGKKGDKGKEDNWKQDQKSSFGRLKGGSAPASDEELPEFGAEDEAEEGAEEEEEEDEEARNPEAFMRRS